ncbi:MAG: hypothetical protein R3Y29_04525 [bacterium]
MADFNNNFLATTFLDKENPILINFNSNSNIINNKHKNINKFCFDGSFYYFISNNSNKIIQANSNLDVINIFTYEHIITSICYDSSDKCFWGAVKDFNNKLIAFNFVDNSFNLLNTLTLNPNLDTLNSSCISSIRFNCSNNTLVVVYKQHILEIHKNGLDYKKIYYTSNGSIIDVLTISPNYLVLVDTTDLYSSHQNKIYQKVYALDQNGKIFDYLDISDHIYVKSMVFNPCYTDVLGVFIDYLIDDSNNLQYLCSKNIIFSNFEYTSYECNYEVCDNNYDTSRPHPRPPKPEPPTPKPPKPEACDDILESIALVEASIACVLNTESLKLKKVLEHSDDLDLILKTNKQINRTIISLTNLEQLLYNKLVTVLEIYELCEIPKRNKPIEKDTPQEEDILKEEDIPQDDNKA